MLAQQLSATEVKIVTTVKTSDYKSMFVAVSL